MPLRARVASLAPARTRSPEDRGSPAGSTSGPSPEAPGGATRPAPGRSPLRAAVAGSMVGKAVEMVTLVLLATVVPRVLGPVDYGRFAVPLTIVTVGSLALTLGGPAVMVRYVPAADPDDRVGLARALGLRLARGRAVQLAAMGAATAVVVALRPDLLPPRVTALVALALVLNVVASLLMQVGLGLGRTGAWSARFPVQNAVLVVAVLVLDRVAGPTGAVVALVVAGAAACVLAALTVGPALRGHHNPVEIPAGARRFGTVQATAAALVQATQRGGVLAVAVLAGSAVQTGYASLATGIALGATYAVLQAFTVCLPHLGVATSRAGGAAAVEAGPSSAPSPQGAAALPSPATRQAGSPRSEVAAPGDGPRSSPAPGPAADVAAPTTPGRPGTPMASGAPEASAGPIAPPAPGAPTPTAEAALRRLAGGLLALIVPTALAGALLAGTLVPAVFGADFEGAARAFAPGLAVVVLAPLHSLAVQGSILRLRPEAALAGGVAGAAAFVVTALLAVPPWGATGGLAAVLAAAGAGLVASLSLLPGLAGRVLPVATAAGAGAVLAAGLAVT